jgi:glycosyltransferase involved in cell wall biosynthesis
MITSCRALLGSSLSRRLTLDLLDSTQISNPPPSLMVRLVLAAARCVRFVVRFERARPDAVLLFVAVGASIVEKGVMAWYARLRGVPAMVFPRGGALLEACRKSAFTRRWVRWAFKGARKMLCQSETWRRFAVEVLGFDPRDAPIVPNWTATPELLAIGERRAFRAAGPVRLLFVGWLERDKGVFELIEACRRLVGQHRFTLDFVGEGRAAAEARALVKRYGMLEIVRFQGWLQEPDVRRALTESDVLVLPSWAEGLPNAMIEAMAARLAVVVSKVGAVPDVIVDRHAGLLVNPKDTESLYRALAEILNDAQLREGLAAEAYKIAAREFGVENAVDRLVAAIEECR